MNKTLRTRQHLIFSLLVGISAILAVMGYHGLHKEMVLFRHGEHLLAGHEYQRAVSLFAESYRQGNSSPQLLKSLGDACLGAGKTPEAIATYRLFLNRFPADRAVRISLARTLARNGRYDEAVIEYRTVLGEKP